MEYRTLGKSDLQVSVIGLGCWAMGGEFWGGAEDADSVAAVRKALDVGMTFIDTADCYGWGRSERAVGEGIRGRRDEAVVATKCARTIDDQGNWGVDCSRSHIMEAVEVSLANLGTDRIDLYQLHTWDENTPLDETLRAMEDLVRAGKVRCIGCSNYSADQLREAIGLAHVVSMQPPYNMFSRRIEQDLLPLCVEQGVAAVVYGSLFKGMLSGKFTPDSTFNEGDKRSTMADFQGERFERNLACVDQLKAIAERRGKTVAQLALAWTARQPGVTVAIAGARRPEQVEDNAGAAGWSLTDDELGEIEGILAQR